MAKELEGLEERYFESGLGAVEGATAVGQRGRGQLQVHRELFFGPLTKWEKEKERLAAICNVVAAFLFRPPVDST